jgi:REP element-mobilizing transposase RayT
MPNTYTQFNLHVVFAVKGRENILSAKIREELFSYIAGIVNNKKHYSLAVNGYKDHVHLFFEYNPAFPVSDLIRDVKSGSTVWINSRKLVPGKFSWQEGYGGFSYSRSQRDVVIKYVMNQEKHHQGKSFKEEYMKLLADFDIEFKNEYLFEFYE